MDAAIIELLRSGRSTAAFEALVSGYRRRIVGLGYSILGDRAAAEDVAQEVFVKLWKALDGYDGRAKLSTWIYAITRNAAISELRKRRPSASLSDPQVFAAAELASAQRSSFRLVAGYLTLRHSLSAGRANGSLGRCSGTSGSPC